MVVLEDREYTLYVDGDFAQWSQSKTIIIIIIYINYYIYYDDYA